MTTAAIAYRHLTWPAKQRVDAILLRHPEALRWDAERLSRGVKLPTGEYRFLKAATWPDEIKHKPNWPNRSAWHYVNFPLYGSTSNARAIQVAPKDILTGLAAAETFVAEQGANDEERAIALAWVIHLVGDLHQPLHCATAITMAHPGPRGDRGGNETIIAVMRRKRVTLHAFWDGLFGTSKDPSRAVRTAILLERRMAPSSVDTTGDDRKWAVESSLLAQSVAYPSATWSMGSVPIHVDGRYVERARTTGERQLMRGGLRLATLLNKSVGACCTKTMPKGAQSEQTRGQDPNSEFGWMEGLPCSPTRSH
jgi:hypothetical protein